MSEPIFVKALNIVSIKCSCSTTKKGNGEDLYMLLIKEFRVILCIVEEKKYIF